MFSKYLPLSFLIFVLSFYSCKKEDPDDTKALVGLGLAIALANPYERITPTDDTITLYADDGVTPLSGYNGRSYSPKCFGNSGNTQFYFFRKSVAANNTKLLINFMGGGACWSNYNCFGQHTTTHLNFLNTLPDLFVKYGFKGILDETAAANPLNDYDVLFIPYCAGDLFFGSQDTVYDDPDNASDPPSYHHRGHDNVLSVLKYIQSHYSQATKVVVAGQSAGGYGAILNYPHIRQTFNKFSLSTNITLLADASNGVVINGFFGTMDTQWGSTSNLPQWVTGIGSTYLTSGSPSIQDYLTKVSSYYGTDKIGQYTAIFDVTQRWFFNVMGIIAGTPGTYTYTDSDSYFGPGDASEVADSGVTSNCNWATSAKNMMTGVKASRPSNYSYYIAPGDTHTKTTDNSMFNLVSDGVNFNDWISELVSGTLPAERHCENGSGSHPCTDTNFISNQYNDALGRSTSKESYQINPSQDLYESCFP